MSLSTTQYGYIVDPMVPFTDDKGKTIKNGFIRVFMAGTSTPVLTYRNYDGATNQEKIELDNSGRVKHNVIGSKGSLYKVVVYNILHSQENPLLTVDKIAVLGASINASGATIVTGLDSVTVQEENFLKATVEGTGVELALDPTEVTSEVSTIGAAETAAPDYVVPLLEKTGTEDSKKISLANLFKFALDWISRLATTITSFASGDFIAVSNSTIGARKMSKDTLLELTAQNALAGNMAEEFVPNSTTTIAGLPYAYNGSLYVAKEAYQGAWDASKFEEINAGVLLNYLKDVGDLNCGNKAIVPYFNHFYTTNVNVGDVVSLTPSASSSGFNCAVVECQENDVFTFYGSGGSGARLWAFVNASNELISKSDADLVLENVEVKAPAGSAKIIVNIKGVFIKGPSVDSKIKENSSDILTLKSGLLDNTERTKNGTIYGVESVKNGNLFSFGIDVVDGKYYYIHNGHLSTNDSVNFYGFILKVEKNTTYSCTHFRFAVLLESDKYTPIGSLLENGTSFNSGTAEYVAVSFNKNTYPVNSYAISKGVTLDSDPYKVNLDWLYQDKNYGKILPGGFFAEKNSPAANSSISVANVSNVVKYNKTAVYMAKFTGSIGDITISHGTDSYYSFVKITSTNIVVNRRGTEVYNAAHGLTIAYYLYVKIDTDDQDGVKVSVMSNGKREEISVDGGWYGWRGPIQATTASALDYHRLVWTCKDCDKPVWLFGDSYLSKTNPDRWGTYLHAWGFDKFLAAGYPGAGSLNVINTLKEMLKVAQPKYVIWMLGMNDPDTSSAINANWESTAKEVLELCKRYNITPIFSKIPNVNGNGTLYNHSFKNAWIDDSGCRSIDVPFAVGADSSGNWYSGLLSGDGVHPTWKGAWAIAYQILADVPELTQSNI